MYISILIQTQIERFKIQVFSGVFFYTQEGQELMESKPEYEPIVTERLAKLHELWDRLESTTQEKARLLFDANRSELFDQSLADMKKWLGELQQQLQGGDEDVKDLTNANILLKKHQVRREYKKMYLSLLEICPSQNK